MAQDLPEVALLSIRPEYAEAILNGTKRVEFRRTRFSRDVSFIVIYATQPVGKVVGWFEVDGIETSTPGEWRTLKSSISGLLQRDGYWIRNPSSMCSATSEGQTAQVSFRTG
jgi:predicted transcriptional regulator